MRACFAAAFAVLLAASQAAAQPPAVQPPNESIEPDRPDVTNGTHIVDSGLVQVEFGGLYTRDSEQSDAFGAPFMVRVGLLDWLEFRLGTDGFVTQSQNGAQVSGFGNVQLGAKLRMWSDPGGAPVLSILPTVNLPTASASKGLGSGDADYTIAFLTGTDLGMRAHVDVNYGIGSIGAGGGQPHFVQQLVSVSASLTVGPKWSPYAEVFWFSREDPAAGATTAFDTGAIYAVNPRFALDGGAQWGLSRAAPDLGVFAGASIVVGEIFDGHGVHARQRRAPGGKPRRTPTRR